MPLRGLTPQNPADAWDLPARGGGLSASALRLEVGRWGLEHLRSGRVLDVGSPSREPRSAGSRSSAFGRKEAMWEKNPAVGLSQDL